MTRMRLLVACLIAMILVLLLGWQAQREQLVRVCLESGGAWTGSSCGPLRIRPILQRDLQRS